MPWWPSRTCWRPPARTARSRGRKAIAAQQRLLRSAAVLGRTATAARATKLERKHHALFDRLITRWNDYQRCVNDPVVPWDNNAAEQTIRMPKLRTKVSGCLRTLTGAEAFAAIRSYITTAARHGQNMLDVLIQAADGHPWILTTYNLFRPTRPAHGHFTLPRFHGTYPATGQVLQLREE